MDDRNKTLIFEHNGLIFVFNFHVSESVPDYAFRVPEAGDYRIILNTDNPKYGGLGRVDETTLFTTQYDEGTGEHALLIYNVNRTGLVFQKVQ